MGKKTSVWLPDDLAEAVAASGVPMTELMRRGLGLAGADEATVAKAAEKAAEAVLDDVREAAREIQQDAVREALRQGGGGYS